MLKRIILFSLFLFVNFAFSQNFKEESNIEKVLTLHLVNKLNQSKKDKIFFEIANDKELLWAINKSSKLKDVFTLEEINQLKIKAKEKRVFHKCYVETDSIFLYNKRRDFISIINEKQKIIDSSKTYKVSLPVFIKRGQYSVFCSYSPYGPMGLTIFKKDDKDKWKNYTSEVFWN